MNVKIGDKVRFLNDVGGGIVTKIANDKLVHILTNDGFDIPTMVNELIVIERATAAEPPKQEQPSKQEPKQEQSIDVSYNYINREEFSAADFKVDENDNSTDVLFAFVKDKSELLSAHLINDTRYFILFNVMKEEEPNKYITVQAGTLEPDTKLFLASFRTDEFSNLASIVVQLIFYRKGLFAPQTPINRKIRLKPYKFYKDGSFIENDYFDEHAMIFELKEDASVEEVLKDLTQKDIKQLIEEKNLSERFDKENSQRYKAQEETPIIEVDLHINQLLENYKGMSNAEILNYQMDRFHLDLQEALLTKATKIVFIHGVGNGTLKSELRKSLGKDYPKLMYQDASFKEYGFGATMVYLKNGR